MTHLMLTHSGPALITLILMTAGATAADSIIPADAALEQLWNEGEFTEGVAAAPDGTIYFSDIPRTDKQGRVLKFDPANGKTTVHCDDSGKSNGLMFDQAGRLFAACGSNGGRRALCEITPRGQVIELVTHFEGRRLNSPNDLVIHPNGSLYFSDPRYIGSEPVELDHQSVYRFTPGDGSLKRVTTDISKPNGVIVSPDGKTLYVAETDNGIFDAANPPSEPVQKRMTLNAFSIKPDGSLGEKRILADFGDQLGIDGMTVDQQGHIYGALRSDKRHGILILTPDGQELGFLPTDDLPTNCCFGRGEDSSVLYVTIGGGLYRVTLNATGHHLSMTR